MILWMKILERHIRCQTSKLLTSFQLSPNPLRNWFIAFLCTSNWFFGPKREKTGLVHFPLGFSCKKFQNFSKNFFAQNCIKRYLRYVDFQRWSGICTHQAHRGSWKNFAEIPDLPRNEKNQRVCLVGAHTWGGGGRAKQSTIPYLYTV